jgi:predicted Zn finger-like uncharacterized protein
LSRMFTTCPNCRLNLAVTAEDLRIGQGYVRCGRCERAFNALASLAEDLDHDQQSGLAATGTTTVPALPDDGHEPLTDEPETLTAAAPPAGPAAAPEQNASLQPPYSHEMDVVESTATGTFETIVLEGDGYLQTEEHVDEKEVDAQLQEMARQMDAQQQPAPEQDAEVHDPPDEEIRHHADENVVLETAAADFDAEGLSDNAPRPHWIWPAAAAALVLALLAQIVHHNRQTLVAHPWFEQPLQSVYAVFGTTLEPQWDLQAYDLRQLGGEALAGTSATIVLRAAIHNRASTRQPPPMIRAVLQDRFGNALSTTAIAPQDYLRGAVPTRMAPDQRLDAELTLADPNKQAVGFELDACLPAADGRLHCSNDP